jgi:thiol-disulfide isomerase/thioredoxin
MATHAPPQVTSEEDFDAALASTDKLVILDAGASWCGPCKVFKPTFIASAKAHAGKALFLSCVGDANGSTAKIMKRLAIKCAAIRLLRPCGC